MMEDFADFSDFNYEIPDDDPLKEIQSREDYLDNIEVSMNYVYDLIERVNIEKWINYAPIQREKKKIILENMISWFESKEEYEKCVVLQTGLKFL